MQNNEQRKRERYEVSKEVGGQVYLRTAGEELHRVNGIKDVSDAGASFFADVEVAPSTKVTVEYVGTGMKLEVYGMVAWCLPTSKLPGAPNQSPPGDYLLGLELISPMLLLAWLRER
jgi:hypothetical protein